MPRKLCQDYEDGIVEWKAQPGCIDGREGRVG